ncbi:MAG: type II toxin-antitoxin system VapC family toxin [Candidatus Korobacteraceae bacterium]
MSGYLLDTNCISELVRIEPDAHVMVWMRAANEKLLHLSVLTLGEIRKGPTLLPASRRRAQLERWLEIELPAQFADRLLPINADIAEIWGVMAGEAQLQGNTIGIIDGFLAATARHHELAIVTRNVRDFRMCGVPVVNPWMVQ